MASSPQPGPGQPAPREPLEAQLRALEETHLPPIEANDPRLAIPAELNRPTSRRPSKPVPGSPGSSEPGTVQQLMRMSTVGTSFAFAVMGGGLLGWVLQKWVWPSATPWPLMIGLFVGLIGGAVRFVHDAKALMK